MKTERRHYTTIPIPAQINNIEKQAQEDNMPLRITFNPVDVTKQHLWIAGVDEEREMEFSWHRKDVMWKGEMKELIKSTDDIST